METSITPQQARRGALAKTATAIPLRGWIDVLGRTWRQSEKDNVFLISAGVAFYFLLALAPTLTAFSAVGTLLISPDAIRTLLNEVGTILPDSAKLLLNAQLEAVLDANQHRTTLTLKAAGSLALAYWAAAAGVRAMMTAVTVAYRETEQRPLLTFHLTSLMLTLAALLIGLCAILAFVAVPLAISIFPVSDLNETLVRLLRWPVIIVAIVIGLSVTYRFAPSRRRAKTKWVTTGAIVSALLWLAGSVLFTTYVEQVANYEAVHGTLSSIVVLLLWFWFSAAVTLIGAELNAEVEHQTSVDTTAGRDRPMGQRGAYVADHVAEPTL
ncbi:YihY/virulence factor BrkB family protein [Roseibium aggregatum]|uniref:YihY/virulence factor BrkB family protein n=1 Tax=Roseibium aggregatum TaxID=187304 RepID=A0A939E9M4_9HYPH|nr:YihY/virulence factor BrkB family protein [Roseibium aggregatum]MBN9669406.1 YihY/virulence factor BrkB family protein [Roseibium aggregatum]